MTDTTIKDRPILFSGAMVRALLDGRKTQTRRMVKPQTQYGVSPCHWNASGWAVAGEDGSCTCRAVRCPYGKVGTRLWVRECFGIFRSDPTKVAYKADTPDFHPLGASNPMKPSIHMPRWASRLTLEITDIRVQRAHQITDADVIAEGVDPIHIEKYRAFLDKRDIHGMAFGELWDSINGAGSWAKNPFVWAITFKVLK